MLFRPLFAFLGLTAAAAPIAYTYMFFGFRSYDDEGYQLLTLSDYVSGKPVVTPYVQLYGPFYYEFWGAVYKIWGIAPDHDSGRVLTLAVWLIAGLLGAVAAYRLTRSLVLAVAAQLMTLSVLTALASEPMTTYGLISILLIGVVVAATFRSARPRASAAVIGGIVSALCLIKINVGCFAAVAVAVAWIASLDSRWRRRLWIPMFAVAAALPFAIMAPRLKADWALEFAVVVAISVAAIGGAAARSRLQPMPPPSTRWVLFGGLLVACVCVAIALASGTRPDDLWNGLIAASVRFPGVFVVPMPSGLGVDVWAVLCIIGAVAFARLNLGSASRTGIVLVWAGVVMWLLAFRQPSSFFLLALPLVWLAARTIEQSGKDSVDAYCRLLVPVLAVIGVLQSYPVAGSQLALSALGLVPVGAMLINDGIKELRRAPENWPFSLKVARWTSPAVLLAALAGFVIFGLVGTAEFLSGVPLNLRGSTALRLPVSQADQLRALTAAINRDCSSFITYPGMDSFYLWTGLKPPTDVRWGLWPLNLNDAQQETAVEQLKGKPRVCVVKNQRVMDFWSQDQQVPRRPLVNFIDESFVVDATFGEYQLLVRE